LYQLATKSNQAMIKDTIKAQLGMLQADLEDIGTVMAARMMGRIAVPQAQNGRLVTGYRLAFSFSSSLNVSRLWVPNAYYTISNSIVECLALTGAVQRDTYTTNKPEDCKAFRNFKILFIGLFRILNCTLPILVDFRVSYCDCASSD
jgi:hypothetical protein